VEIGVPLTVVPSEGEAAAICGLLRAHGISCGHRAAGHGVETFGDWWHEILVAPSQLEEARALLDADAATPPQ
jgi:hypothetical protein